MSPENPSGEKGQGGLTNKGANVNAFYVVAPGETKVLFNVQGAGIINRMWLSGTIGINAKQRRAVRIEMFWDGAKKPAVSAQVTNIWSGVASHRMNSIVCCLGRYQLVLQSLPMLIQPLTNTKV